MRYVPRVFAFAVLAGLAFIVGAALAGCSGSRLAPGANAALGWRATPELTGPAIDVGLGEYDLGNYDGPFGSPDGATSAPAQAQPDPALVQALKDLEAKQAESAQRLSSLDAKVAAGDLTAEQAEAIKVAAQKGDESAEAARAAAAKVDALQKQLAEVQAKPAPSFLPDDWTVPGLIAFGLAWARYLWGKRQAKALADALAKAKAEAMAHTARAIEAFDELPDTATAAEVREKVRPTPPA